MRYWVISCSVLMGSISCIRTGEPGRIIASLVIGAVIGVVLYGIFVSLTSTVSSAYNISYIGRKNMYKFVWLWIFFMAVIVQSIQGNFMYALGANIPLFVLGLVFSPIWWGITKKKRKLPWQWFDWLNTGSYIMLVLFMLKFIVDAHMKSQGVI